MMTASLLNMVNSHFFLVVRILRSTVLVALNNAVFKNQTLYPLLPVSTAVVMDVREIQERVFGNHWSTQGKENAPSPPPPPPPGPSLFDGYTRSMYGNTQVHAYTSHTNTHRVGLIGNFEIGILDCQLGGKEHGFLEEKVLSGVVPTFSVSCNFKWGNFVCLQTCAGRKGQNIGQAQLTVKGHIFVILC